MKHSSQAAVCFRSDFAEISEENKIKFPIAFHFMLRIALVV